VGERTDDVKMFKQGDEAGLRLVYSTEGEKDIPTQVANFVAALAMHGSATAGIPMNLGTLRLKDIDDLRDHWSHKFSRPEQERLIRLAARARTTNRAGGKPRGLLFVGGDLHCGGLFRLDIAEPRCTVECLISSGIGKETPHEFPGLRSTAVDTEFDVADGIHATLKSLVRLYNFGIVSVIPDGRTAQISAHVVHEGWYAGSYGLSLGQPPGLNSVREKLRGIV